MGVCGCGGAVDEGRAPENVLYAFGVSVLVRDPVFLSVGVCVWVGVCVCALHGVCEWVGG